MSSEISASIKKLSSVYKMIAFSTLCNLEVAAFYPWQAGGLFYAYSSPTSDISNVLEKENKTWQVRWKAKVGITDR